VPALWLLVTLLAAVAAEEGPAGDREAVYQQVEGRRGGEHREALRTLYRSSGYEPVWLDPDGPTPQARIVIRALQDAAQKGLRAADYDGPLWPQRIADLPRSQADVLLSAAVIRYVSDMKNGRVNPRALRIGLRVREDEREVGALAWQLSRPEAGEATLAALEPAFPVYRRTLEALQHYLALAALESTAKLPVPRRRVRPGGEYPAVVLLARRLRLLGDLPAWVPEPRGKSYGGDLAAAVGSFQARHGLPRTGVLDAATVQQLDTPLRQRAAQLALTLERMRWLPRRFSSPPLVVNIPEFRLHADGLSMRVVVGRAWKHQTPVFAGGIDEVIFRPYWEVPRDIALEQLLPALEKDLRYAEREDLELVDRSGRPAGDFDAAALAQVREGSLHLRQRPGDRNALGLVKFAFPNEYSIYLHGTPSARLFARSRRDFSHGCIRVEDPERLASWVLRGDPQWTAERIRAAISGADTVRARPPQPIPVLILYTTAIAGEDGVVQFFDDIYGQDRALERALAAQAHRGEG